MPLTSVDFAADHEGALFDAVGQGFAVDEFHDHVAGADVKQRTNIRMIERRHGAGFALEAPPQLFTVGNMFGQHFDCDRALKPRVESFVHFAHAPLAYFRENSVRPQIVRN